jgi:hypothetical protein
MVLGHKQLEILWKADSRNRLNLMSTFLVLLAGSGSDHSHTRWSAKACEEYVGIGRPRAKRAIEELVTCGLCEIAEGSTALKPQYLLQAPGRDDPVIYLPVQLVTGFAGEASILRRVHETGDALLLRMLLDLYGGLEDLDVTHGLPLRMLRQYRNPDEAHKVAQVGVNQVWALTWGTTQGGEGDWTTLHFLKGKGISEPWSAFWDRIRVLGRIGALWFEPWVFAGSEVDAEPLWPVDLEPSYSEAGRDDVTDLTLAANDAATALFGERTYLGERYEGSVLVPLPLHHQQPALRGVARLRVEPDTPGFRRAYGARKSLIEKRTAELRLLEAATYRGEFDRPLGAARESEPA